MATIKFIGSVQVDEESLEGWGISSKTEEDRSEVETTFRQEVVELMNGWGPTHKLEVTVSAEDENPDEPPRMSSSG